MPIVTAQGIVTAELCENSKKYLSRLLADRIVIGARIKNPDFIRWEELLDLNTDNLEEDLIEYLDWRLRTNAEHDDPCNKENLKQHIVNKLAKIETDYLPERLKHLESYKPEVKKHQEDLRHKKHALVSIAIIIGLAIAFPYALPLMGGFATLVGVLSLGMGAGLLCCSIIPAFFGERLIDPEWDKQYSIENEKYLKITAFLEITAAKIVKAKTEEPISNQPTSNVKQTEQTQISKPKRTLTANVTKSATPRDYFDNSISVGFFNTIEKLKAENILYDHEQRTFVPTCISS